jgi:hypothetical protein
MNLIHFADLLIICENNSRIRLLFADLLSVSGLLETGDDQESAKFENLGSLSSGTTVSGDFHE